MIQRPNWSTGGYNKYIPTVDKYYDYFYRQKFNDEQINSILIYLFDNCTMDVFKLIKNLEQLFNIEGDDELYRMVNSSLIDRSTIQKYKVFKWVEDNKLQIPHTVIGMETKYGNVIRIIADSYHVDTDEGFRLNFEKLI